ncbi:HSP20-like chaperone [Ilyonectria sp. MPI-CAGE-AT-0026]|nr:HSP20-like chaperone [Ilyonectria sp. MPI-CAGE-AT-0026]
MATTSLPEVLWAQRSSITDEEKNFVYMTITAPDVLKSDIKLDLKPTGVTFTGTSTTLKKTFHLDVEFFDEVVPEKSRINHTGKNIEMKLQKKELKEEYWPRLFKEKARYHFLKTDFDKWVDEDEQNENAEEDMSQFGGMGGMPGMDGGAGGDFGGIDFSKLGGAGGLPDMQGLGGMGGIPGMGAGAGDDEEEEDDDDDDEIPDLEGDAPKPAAAAAATTTTTTTEEKKA